MEEVLLWEESMVALFRKDVVPESGSYAGVGLELFLWGVAEHFDHKLKQDKSRKASCMPPQEWYHLYFLYQNQKMKTIYKKQSPTFLSNFWTTVFFPERYILKSIRLSFKTQMVKIVDNYTLT